MFLHLEQILISYASRVPLAIFSLAVSFIEEVIPPIPSPSVMLATGAMAFLQGYLIPGLLVLTLLGAIGKTLGASVAYYIADKVEDLLLTGRVAKFVGITHEQIEAFGKRLGHGTRDYIILIILRALPIVPSSILSLGCGLLKVRFRLFVISTFLGSLIRDFLYIYVGYIGTTVALSFIHQTNSVESIINLLVVLVIVIVLGFLYFRRGKEKGEKLEG